MGDKKRFLDRILRFMGIEEEVAATDEFVERDQPSSEPVMVSEPPRPNPETRRPQRAFTPPEEESPVRSKVHHLEPLRFNDVQAIADHLLRREAVVVSVEYLDKGTARRVLDFLSGTIYAMEGDIQRVREHQFLIAPKGLDLGSAGSMLELDDLDEGSRNMGPRFSR